jgi:hypothetical protein
MPQEICNLQAHIKVSEMLTKELIAELKNNGNGDLGYLVAKQQDSSSIVFILENLESKNKFETEVSKMPFVKIKNGFIFKKLKFNK